MATKDEAGNLALSYCEMSELLTCLQEECAEVIQIICKIVRHGESSYDPTNIAKGDNLEQLRAELLDLNVWLTLLEFTEHKAAVPSMSYYAEKQKYLHSIDIIKCLTLMKGD